MDVTAIESAYELERGKPMPSLNHAAIQVNLVGLLFANYRERYRILSELNVQTDNRKRIPDIALYPPMQLDFSSDQSTVEHPALGVVEILSPDQSLSELVDKSKEYFESGVQSYWLVLPALRTIYVFHNPDDYHIFSKADTLHDDKLDIALELSAIFS